VFKGRTATAKRQQKSQPPLAALSLGTANTVCVIAMPDPEAASGLRVLGTGRVASVGMKAGLPVDLDGAERSVRLAVTEAEKAADLSIDTVTLVASGGGLSSRILQASVPVDGMVSESHIIAVSQKARAGAHDTTRSLIYAAPLHYSVDNGHALSDPRRMYAQELTLRLTTVLGHAPSLKNLAQVVSRAHLKIDAVIASPFAAAKGVLLQEEMLAGALVLDFGAGSTGIAVFAEGGLIHLESLPVGAGLVTSDLARGLHTTQSVAERIKTSEANLLLDELTAAQKISAPRIGEDGRLAAGQSSRGQIASYCGPRLEETLQMTIKRFKASGQMRAPISRVVLTGGGSHFKGLRELAEDVLRAPVRMGLDTLLPGLCEREENGIFAAAAGALRLRASGLIAVNAAELNAEGTTGEKRAANEGRGFNGALHWLKENF
jgi:cell division protein FtsA